MTCFPKRRGFKRKLVELVKWIINNLFAVIYDTCPWILWLNRYVENLKNQLSFSVFQSYGHRQDGDEFAAANSIDLMRFVGGKAG